ncbi:MAG: PHP domain-containing protein, partial [Lachnospiraceae bacterium]|nr:PHP domain-containing protein [Lachnospiraceae bacterium]
MNIVDLHTHSNKSDGSLSPAELVHLAAKKGLSAIALTDHDTTDGIDEAMAVAAEENIELIPGIEFSTEYEGRDIHIVGLYIDHNSEYFKRRLVNFVNGRLIRNREMCRRLTEHGMPVTYEELIAEFPDSVITRAHFARYLLNHGYTKSLKEAFDRYIGDRSPCFVPRKKITPMRAVEIILKAGGFPILAHPVLYGMSMARLDQLVARLKQMGLQGIEAIYSTYAAADERDMRRLADKYDLCISGGSDFHGKAKPGLELATGYGKLFIPEEILDRIKERRKWMKENPEQLRYKKILFTDLD